jgi:hypothetical protein
MNWLAIFIYCHGVCEYFESFALKPIIRDHILFMKNNCKKVISNKKCLQSLESSLCGHYCCLFILLRSVGMSMTNFVKLYKTRDCYKNDSKTILAFMSMFGSYKGKSKMNIKTLNNMCCCSRRSCSKS